MRFISLTIYFTKLILSFYVELDITNNPDFIEILEMRQKIHKNHIKIFVSAYHKDTRICHDQTYNLIYIYTYRPEINHKDSFLYLADLQNHKLYLISHDNIADRVELKDMYCHGGLLIYTLMGQRGIWTRYSSNKKIYYVEINGISDFVTHDTSHHVALLSKDGEVRTLNPVILSKHDESEFGIDLGSSPKTALVTLKISEIIDVNVQNSIVLVTLKQFKHEYASVWLAELADLNFTQISINILGADSDESLRGLLISKIDYYTSLINKLPGIIIVSQIVRNKKDEIKKLSMISYNFGNSFLPLKYKSDAGYCDWSQDNGLFKSIQTLRHNPLIMISSCMLVIEGRERLPRLMISTDTGYSWTDGRIPARHQSVRRDKCNARLALAKQLPACHASTLYSRGAKMALTGWEVDDIFLGYRLGKIG
ncbi:hypothetical protein RF11_03788 [Thelohanellus kitauei]|uniref:Sortilin N-terminal domain-containing protein n=1 Tax=Thelohanellus kitauei TaxID=669202 RepID=A0A0C2ITY2_THEKT|nr:hypothetical protein RF11_03788 [Thelohanellus kitauei]